ncbi:MAG: mechanosensitive ion channel family protein [Colwellia sp.]|nr:mechanosensitive ion channel family protein [Colwellia sp.]
MIDLITTWLTQQGLSADYIPLSSILVGTVIILFLCSISYYLAKHQVLVVIKKIVAKSRNTWDDLIFEEKVFANFALLIPFIFLLFLTPLFISIDSIYGHFLISTAKVAISFQVARCAGAILNVIKSLYKQTAQERYLPLNATIQVIKLVIYLIATILAISIILDRSPIYLLSGLGALTAVLLLVFQDTIKGLVASIQISANKMVAPGDWIEIPTYGADGDVLEIGLNTVKVQNFDNTVTTVPTYALMSGSFKNWRDMFNSGGRRIKRTISIDISSITFHNTEQIEKLSKINLISSYLKNKQKEISSTNEQSGEIHHINNRQLTNIGTFRAYIEAYLKQHEKVHHQMTCMVRQLSATPTGLPLELYFFSNDQNWVNYEAIQADIFDHLFAMVPIFNLRVFQHPTGHDWRQK